jgi:hypothetical protein
MSPSPKNKVGDVDLAAVRPVDAEHLQARRLRRRLERILEVLERSEDPSVSELTRSWR